MKLGTMIADVARGLLRPPATRKYPFERTPTPARLRGQLRWDPERCTSCGMCATDCPANVLTFFTYDKATHRIVMRYDLGGCTYCGQCVQSCNKDSITLVNGAWELAAYDRAGFTLYYGAPDDVERAMAEDAEAGARPGASAAPQP